MQMDAKKKAKKKKKKKINTERSEEPQAFEGMTNRTNGSQHNELDKAQTRFNALRL